jgi:cobalamin biosynthesis Co2+ chelatase CbiK
MLILENLKEKTGIPFAPLMMDVMTLERVFKAGLYKELTATDIKVINGKRYTKLVTHADVVQFMLDNNCKVEQEAIKAVELMD